MYTFQKKIYKKSEVRSRKSEESHSNYPDGKFDL